MFSVGALRRGFGFLSMKIRSGKGFFFSFLKKKISV